MNTEAVTETSNQTFFEGKHVAFVGRLGGVTRREAGQLVREHGGVIEDDRLAADLIVIGADEPPLSANGDSLSNEIQRRAADGLVEIICETQLWQQMGLLENEKNVHKLYTPAMLAELIGVSVHKVRRWHRRGLIVPAREVRKLPYFDFLEISTARNIAGLVAAGMSPGEIENKISQLSEFLPDVQRPLAQLSVIVEGRELLLRSDEGLVEPGGQLRIDFDSLEADADDTDDTQPVATLRMPTAENDPEVAGPTSPESMLELAESLEDDCQFDDAADTYRSMLMAFGPTAETNFHLAELLYRTGDINAARERFYTAIELDEEFVEARANLGCVLAEQGDLELAVSAFEGALEYHADYPDVHFHLARVYEQLERTEDARHHWQKFLELSPENMESPWAEEAISRLDQ